MKRIIMIHRWAGGPDDDWRPWLKSEFEKRGYEVYVPEMPDTETPVIEKWVGKIAGVVGMPDKDTYFVGHSIGCQAILRYIDSHRFGPLEKVGGAVFVAGWFDLENMEDEESVAIAKPWIETPINIEKIKTVLPHSALIISDNDPYGCFEENKENFAKLGAKIVVIPNAGHITAKSGFTELPEVIEEVESY
jgi:predicted alpha/beta hydrolase family esterase